MRGVKAFTEFASRTIQSIGCNVHPLCVVCLSPLPATGTKRAGDFWSKSVLLKLKLREPLYFKVLTFLGSEISDGDFWFCLGEPAY